LLIFLRFFNFSPERPVCEFAGVDPDVPPFDGTAFDEDIDVVVPELLLVFALVPEASLLGFGSDSVV
jgi:hypothetical protein